MFLGDLAMFHSGIQQFQFTIFSTRHHVPGSYYLGHFILVFV